MKTKHPLYTTWCSLKSRCLCPTSPYYKYYGERGITVCERWQKSFPAFVEDMGERPKNFTIDRIDNNGPYSKDNCRWVSRADQMLNTRSTRFVDVEGIRYKAHTLAKMAGLKTDTIIERAKTCKTLAEILSSERRIFWDGLAMTPNRRDKTHCKSGHEYTEENTYWTPGGYRQCRACNLRNDRKRRAKG